MIPYSVKKFTTTEVKLPYEETVRFSLWRLFLQNIFFVIVLIIIVWFFINPRLLNTEIFNINNVKNVYFIIFIGLLVLSVIARTINTFKELFDKGLCIQVTNNGIVILHKNKQDEFSIHPSSIDSFTPYGSFYTKYRNHIFIVSKQYQPQLKKAEQLSNIERWTNYTNHGILIFLKEYFPDRQVFRE